MMPLTAAGKPERKGSAWKDGTDAGLFIFGRQRRANMPPVSEILSHIVATMAKGSQESQGHEMVSLSPLF